MNLARVRLMVAGWCEAKLVLGFLESLPYSEGVFLALK